MAQSKMAWKEVALQLPLSARPAFLAGAAHRAQEELLLLLQITTTAGLMLEHMYVCVCVCVYVVSEGAPT